MSEAPIAETHAPVAETHAPVAETHAPVVPAAHKARVLVLFYSTYGHNYAMAKAAVEGAKNEGAEVTLKRIPETLPAEVLEKMHATEAAKQWADIQAAEVHDLPNYDAIILSVPTRFGSIPAQAKTFLDATGGLWFSDALVGKIGSAMSSSNTQHGGAEMTLHDIHHVMFHLGMVVVGLPYSFKGQSGIEAVKGGSPYGATMSAGPQGERMPSETELDAARFQAAHVAKLATKLTRP
jgi:NAD(P)H dehydrogenase (quinone)